MHCRYVLKSMAVFQFLPVSLYLCCFTYTNTWGTELSDLYITPTPMIIWISMTSSSNFAHISLLSPVPPAQLPSTVRPAASASYEGWLEMHLLASHLRPLESQSALLARSLGDSCSHSSLKSTALAFSTRLSHRHLLWRLSQPASPPKALFQGRLYSPPRIKGNRTSP